MTFRNLLTDEARQQLQALETQNPQKHRKILKTLGLMETNIHHQSLQAHEFRSLKGPNQEKVFDAYVENKTPAAYRILWYYGPETGAITVITITPHP